MVAVVLDEAAERSGGLLAPGRREVAQLEQERVGLDVGQPDDLLADRALAHDAQDAVGRDPRLDDLGHGRRGATHGDHGLRPVADPLEEVRGELDGTLLALVGGAARRREAVDDATEQGGRRPRRDRVEVQRERVGEPLQLVRRRGVRLRCRAGERDPEDDERRVPQAEPLERLPGAGAALDDRADQVGADPPAYVGAGTDPQQVQGDQLGGVDAATRSARR